MCVCVCVCVCVCGIYVCAREYVDMRVSVCVCVYVCVCGGGVRLRWDGGGGMFLDMEVTCNRETVVTGVSVCFRFVFVREVSEPRTSKSPPPPPTPTLLFSLASFLSVYSLLISCLTPQQHVSLSQGRICMDNSTCCYIEIEVDDQTFHLTQSQYTDTGPTTPSTDPMSGR